MRTIGIIMLLLAGIFSAAVITPAEVSLKKDEAKAAFDQLNKVRANPGEYSETIGANLKKIEKRPALIWNDLLVKVAEEKAMDMATRDYLAHENKRGEGINIMIHRSGYKLDESWIEDKSSNYFESIQAGTESGVEMINDLILDEYDKSLGHRKHLLGMGDWNASLVDCGIALAHKADSKFKIYSVVIIAKRAN